MRHSIPILFSLVALFAPHTAMANPACPPPSVAQAGSCVLHGDATLNDTMWLASGTTLNCQGHRLKPMSSGTLDNPRTPTNEFVPSHPELALFVRHAFDVNIQNCIISGFDFGIIVAQSKAVDAPGGQTGNKILGNTIDVRTNPIDVINSDGVLISGNQLTYASERGRGVVIDFDSDHNQIVGNTITSTDAASTGQVLQLPGGPFVTDDKTAIMDNKIHILQADKELQNFIVSGVLVQVPAGVRQSDLEDTARSSNNLVTLNNIVDLGVGPSCTLDPGTSCQAATDCAPAITKGTCLLKQDSGVGFNIRASDTIVLGNKFSGRMQRGISFGGVAAIQTFPNWFPGTCTLKASQLCSMDSDCNISGTPNAGTCTGVGAVTFNGNTLRLSAVANVLSGEYDNAALFANMTDTFTFGGNVVNAGASGIRINSSALNGTVERNIVSGAGNALALQPPFTHVIRLNDFTHYDVAIRTSNDFTIHTDIATDKGNYWGLPCPGFIPSLVLFDSRLVNPSVVDGKPYGVPVALTLDPFLPKSCH